MTEGDVNRNPPQQVKPLLFQIISVQGQPPDFADCHDSIFQAQQAASVQ